MSDIAIIEKLRAALETHHRWQLAQTDPVMLDGDIEIIPADEYGDSGMCEDTMAALHLAEAEIARRCGREENGR